MFELTKKVAQSARDAITRTPVESAIGVAMAIFFSVAIETSLEGSIVATVMMCGVLLWTLVFAISSLSALKVFDPKIRWALTTAVTAAVGAYGVMWLDVETVTELWRFAFLFLGALMGVMLVPVAAKLGNADASERFWRFNMRLAGHTVIAGAYAALLFFGLSAGVAAIDGLFDLSIDGELYGHLFSFICIGLASLLTAGGLSDIVKIDEEFNERSLKLGGLLGSFLFIPLVMLYLGIMYAYFGKVLLTGDVPSNILSPLALGAGILGYLGMFCLQPYVRRDDFKPLAFVLRLFPVAFIPIVPLGAWAVWERINQYGITEFRYARFAALVCLGLFSLVGTVQWIRRQHFSLTIGPAILAFVSVMSAVGPWGASWVAERSQQARMVEAARAGEFLDAKGQLDHDLLTDAHGEHASTVAQTARYLLETHGVDAVRDYTAVDIAEFDNTHERLLAMGVSTYGVGLIEARHRSLRAPNDEPFAIPTAGRLFDVSASSGYPTQNRGLQIALSRTSFSVEVDGRNAVADLTPLITRLEETSDDELPDELYRRPLMLDGEAVGYLLIRDSSATRPPSKGWEFSYVSGFVVLP